MAKVLKTAAIIVGVAALAATGLGALGIGAISAIGANAVGAAAIGALGAVGAGTLTLAAVGLNLAAGFFAPKPQTPLGQFSSSPITFSADMYSGLPYVIGRTGFAGRIIKVGNSGYVHADDPANDKPNYYLHYHVALSLGPIHEIEAFVANKVTVAFGSDGSTSTDPYSGFMWQRTQLGTQPETAMTQPVGSLDNDGAYSGWDSSHKGNGLALAWWILAAENPPYSSGVPTVVWILQGALVYDPRKDSTYPGGSGSHRVDDESTWTYSENPFLHGLTYLLGRYQNGKRVCGVGASPAAIDFPAFVNGANVCDANGWKVGGVIFTTDSKWDVLKAMLQAGGGTPLQLRASVSCVVRTPRVSIATITDADLVGPCSVPSCLTRRDRINQIIPTYRSEDHQWQQVAAAPVTVSAYVTADRGEVRSREVVYSMIQCKAGDSPDQAAQIAYYDIADTREIGPFSVQVRTALMGYLPGDCVTFNCPGIRLIDQKSILTRRSFDPKTAAVNLTAVGETDAKHALALAQTGVAPPIDPSDDG